MSTGPASEKYFNYETQQWVDRPNYLDTQGLSGTALEMVKAVNEVISLWEKSLLDTFKIMAQQASIYKSLMEWKPANEEEQQLHLLLIEHVSQLEAYYDAYRSTEDGPPDWNGKDDLGVV
jgi:hypothetical protein